MSTSSLLSQLDVSGVRGRLIENEPLSKYTWFQVGGPAELLFSPADEEDLAVFLKQLPREVPLLIVGIGSNLLVRDGGINGVVVRLGGKGFGQLEIQPDNRILAGAALPDKRLAAAALKEGLGGFEFYHGIPGALGGALRMNAGANGTETTDRVVEVHALDRKGNRHVLSHDDMGYSYRHSQASPDLIFTKAVFEGVPSNPSEIQAKMDEVQHHRETVQPIKEKTGGSTFKNPLPHSSWKLIDEAGLRGHSAGGAQMSEMHCNFMINKDGASAFDLESLGELVRKRVYENSGILLEWEIKRLGNFEPGREVEIFSVPT